MTADTVGGVWTYALELAEALKPYGIEISLAAMGAPFSAGQREALDEAGNIKLFESSYKLEWMEDPWQDVDDAGRWLLKLEEKVQPDIIHLNGYSHGSLPFQAPVLIVAHSCVYSWYYAVKNHGPSDEWQEYKKRVSEGLASAALVTAPTEAMLSVLSRHYGNFNKAGAVFNARNGSEFMPGNKEHFILSAGRLWDEAKNVSMLANIAPRLTWPVYVAGDKEAPRLTAAEQLKHVNWLGRLSSKKLAAWMKRASLYVLPARYEPFGLSALEAALSGCALVLGDIPSLREVWQDNAWFVPPDDHEALTDAVSTLSTDEELRQENAENVHRRALYFSRERMAEGYLALYEKMLSSKDNDNRAGLLSTETG